ncbi:MAG: hypothetical protein ACKVPJ_10925 [Chitinophagales bacterium]
MRLFLLFFLFSFLFSCRKNEKEITRSFYYWQSSYQLSAHEKQTLTTLSVQKLYIKFFDVHWEVSAGQPVPVASINFSETIPDGIEIIPVVYITNETLQKLNNDEVKTLAFKINKKIEDILEENNLAVPAEIQLDCDWSETTKEKYFFLIEEMKKFPLWEKVRWSATIRLHQIKYVEKTGAPPVNRGMLMFYNMGNIKDASAKNSIYETEIAKQYLAKVSDYPLPLDAAIACYSWGLLFDDTELLKIFYPLYPADLPDTLFKKQSENIFTAKRNFYFEGSFLTQGNVVKLETMNPSVSLESAKLLAKELKNNTFSVILYHLDSTIVKNYTNEGFENIYSAFE